MKTKTWLSQNGLNWTEWVLEKHSSIADVAISKRPLLFTVWMQLRLRSHQNFKEIFTRKQFLPISAGNAQAQLHFRDNQQRAFGISNISNCKSPSGLLEELTWWSEKCVALKADV